METGMIVDKKTGRTVDLAMQRLDVTGRVFPIGALLRVTHQFKILGSEPVECLYVSMLPRGGALRRFIVKGKDFEVKSELHPRAKARATYDEGTAAGHLSVLAEADKDGLVTLSVGQIQPDDQVTVILEVVCGVDTKDSSFRFRYPLTIAPSYHPKASMTPTPSGMAIELPNSVFGDLILPEWKTGTDGLHEVSFNLKVEPGATVKSISSPSHRVRTEANADGSVDVALIGSGDVPNRDLVIDVETAEPISVVFVDEGLLGATPDEMPVLPKDAPRWVSVSDSSNLGAPKVEKRQVVLLVDHSGSMDGKPLKEAKLATRACLSALDPEDLFGIVIFDDRHTAFHHELVPATDANRARADKFVAGIQARGGTDLIGGLGAAVEVLGSPGGDIFLLTDGQVFDTGAIIEQMAASGTRVHSLGIGSASQDRFLASLSRRTKGVSAFVGPRENVAEKTLELFNSAKTPLITDAFALVNGANGKTEKVGTVWTGFPVVIFDPRTGVLPSDVKITSPGTSTSIPMPVGTYRALPEGLVALLWAARRVEDLESTFDMAVNGPLKVSLEQELATVSAAYGIASRAMSLVAVVKRAGDQPGEMLQTVVPVGMPEDMDMNVPVNVGTLGLCRGMQVNQSMHLSSTSTLYCCDFDSADSNTVLGMDSSTAKSYTSTGTRSAWAAIKSKKGRRVLLGDCDEIDNVDFGAVEESLGIGAYNPRGVGKTELTSGMSQNLITLVARLEADGGMPGTNKEHRFLLTLLLTLAIAREGADKAAMFRSHMKRMEAFLNTQALDGTSEALLLKGVLDQIKAGNPPSPDQDFLAALVVLQQSPDQIETTWKFVGARPSSTAL